MGYSVTFKVKSEKLGQKIIAFLREHGRSLDFLRGKKTEPLLGPYWADGTGDEKSRKYGGLSYCRRKGHIGFDYGWDREYKYILIKWMAQKIGSLRKGKPAYLYDGYEWEEISSETNELGMQSHPTERDLVWFNQNDLAIIQEEMQRLNGLWNKNNM